MKRFTFAFLSLTSLSFLFGCPPVKAVEGGVHVDTQNCHENAASAGNLDRSILDCVSGGDVTVRIELARSAWDAIRQENERLSDAGISDGGPEAYAVRIVTIDGSHCREDATDDGASENARLACINGPYPYRVYLGRQEWRAIKARTKPAPFEAGPGK